MLKRPRLKDIAERLNISIATVSRALNSKYDISETTRNEVLRVAKELNYRPNGLAVSLRKNEYNVVGVILPNIDHYFFTTVLKGIMNKAHMANYLIIIGESLHDIQKEKEILEQFMDQCVTGILISPTNKSAKFDNLSVLRNKQIPFVLVDRPLKDDEDSCVKYDDPNGAFLAIEHLIDQGFTRIAYIKGPDHCIISNARFDGYKAALKKHKLPIDPSLIKSAGLIDAQEDGYLLAKQLLLMKNRPDSIFAVTDNAAAGIYQAASELNISIPNELGVVGYSNSLISSYLSPPLSTVEQPGVKMGEQAFDFLQQIIIGNSSLFKRTFEARLIVRESSVSLDR